MSTSPPAKVRCRQIGDADVEAVVGLLTQGFPLRERAYWQQALNEMARHRHAENLPKYGYMLEHAGLPVGVILLIFTTLQIAGTPTTRCNFSSWYVEPAFRSCAPMLVSQALKHKDVTYLNISAAPHTRPVIEAQGFVRYSDGQFIAAPALTRPLHDGPVQVMKGDRRPPVPFEAAEFDLLRTHADYGCISIWCTTPERAHAFAFLPRLVKGIVPCAQLVYCRDIETFTRFASPVGRYLALRGRPLTIVDANGPIPNLVGKYVPGKLPRYFKGPRRPQIGDLAYTEAVMFGL
jgi:hypothetical protein